MNNRHFSPVMLLALAIPLLAAVLGFLLYGPGKVEVSRPVDSAIQWSTETGEPILVGQVEESAAREKDGSSGFREMIVYIALLSGLIALLWQYLKTSLAWLAVILLPLLFAFLYRGNLSLAAFYLPNLAFAALIALMLKYIFFNYAVMRFRMILSSLIGAALFTLYILSLHLITRVGFQSQQWSQNFITGMILFVFVTFGLSLADLMIQRTELKRLRALQPTDEEDDEANA